MKQNCQTSLKMGCIMYLSLSVPFREYLMFLHFLARVASSSECKLTTIRNNGLQTPLSIELGFIKQITLCKELLYVACNAKIVFCVTISMKLVMEIYSVSCFVLKSIDLTSFFFSVKIVVSTCLIMKKRKDI